MQLDDNFLKIWNFKLLTCKNSGSYFNYIHCITQVNIIFLFAILKVANSNKGISFLSGRSAELTLITANLMQRIVAKQQQQHAI